MRKIVFLWIALIMVSLHAFADEKVSFTASAIWEAIVRFQIKSYSFFSCGVPSILAFSI